MTSPDVACPPVAILSTHRILSDIKMTLLVVVWPLSVAISSNRAVWVLQRRPDLISGGIDARVHVPRTQRPSIVQQQDLHIACSRLVPGGRRRLSGENLCHTKHDNLLCKAFGWRGASLPAWVNESQMSAARSKNIFPIHRS